jgi:thiamine pyrophosphokinase
VLLGSVRHDDSVETVVIFAGGGKPIARRVRSLAASASFVIAADAGADHALALDQRIDLAVGDFDSISAGGLATLERTGVRLERHPVDKDATDLELALDAAAALRPRRIVVVGGAGGRLDHLLGELSLLAAAAYRDVEIDALLGRATVHVVHRERVFAGRAGEVISLLACHGPAHGVTTDGLAYPLRGETLQPGSTRGLSNVFAVSQARVALAGGVLLALRPL